MSGFVERISVIIDTKVDQGVAGLKSFRSSIAEADGMRGKFKAGWQQTTQAIGNNMGTMAVAAGGALVAFGVKAVAAFESTAKAALDMGKATGLSTEQASRWIAVGDDYAVTAEQLTVAVGRIAKTLDSTVWEKYGVATRDAGGDALSTNAILIDSLATLSAMSSGTDRAQAGQAMFGKGFANLAPLIGKTSDEYRAMLASVEAGQVITAAEAKKAEKMRLAQDKLADALQEVTLEVGSQVAALAPYIEKVADLIVVMEQLKPYTTADDIGSLGDQMRSMAQDATDSGDAIAYLVDKGYTVKAAGRFMADYGSEVTKTKAAEDELTAATDAMALAQLNAESSAKRLAKVLKDQRDAAIKAAESLYDAESASLAADESYRGMLDTIDELGAVLADDETTQRERESALIDVRQAQIDATQAAADAAEAYANEKGAAEGSRQSYLLQIAALEESKKKYPELAAEIDKYIAKLKEIPGVVNTNVTINGAGNFGGSGGGGNGGNTGTGTDGYANAAIEGGAAPVKRGGESAGDTRGSTQPIVVQFVVNDRVVQEITAVQNQQQRGTR